MRPNQILTSIVRLWNLALPLIIVNVATPFLGLADAAISGHLEDSFHLAAVTLGAGLLAIFFGIFSFLRMGTTGLVAQAIGSENQPYAVQILFHATLLAIGFGCLVLIVGPQAIGPILAIANPSASITAPLNEYLKIRLWAAPASLMLFVLTGWFIGQGLTRISLYLAIGTNLINIALNYSLAIGLELNSLGIALGTSISEYLGVILGLGFLFHQLSGKIIKELLQVKATVFVRLFKVNAPLMVRTIALQTVFVMLSIYAARLGTVEASALGLLLVLLATAAFGLDGFAYACEIEAGQSLGHKNYKRLKNSLIAGLILTTVTTLMLIVFFRIWHTAIFALLTDFVDVLQLTNKLSSWFTWMLLALCWSYWLDGIFIGLTRTLDMCITMCFALASGWLGGLWIFGIDSLDALMAAFIVFAVVRTASLGSRLPFVIRKIRRLMSQKHSQTCEPV